MNENQFFIDSEYLSPEALERKHRLEQDPSFRTNHMEYMKGMEIIQSDIKDKVLKAMDEFDYDALYSAKDTFNGQITGYIFNCPLCGGTLACMSSYNIKDGTTTYPDSQYGTVNIVASSANLPCGSIVKFDAPRISSEPIIAIVLDRGVPGNDLDLLSPSYDYAIGTVGRFNASYDVLRSGWNNES